MPTSIEDITHAVRAAQTAQALWDVLAEYMRDQGVKRASYHLYHSPTSTDPRDVTVMSDGFPEDWVCQYIEQKLYLVDPIPMLSRMATSPFFWDDIKNLVKTTAEQDAFLQKRRAAGIHNGLAIHVYGPAMRNGYVGLGFSPSTPRPTPEAIFDLQCVAQIGHLRYCEMTADTSQHHLDLSPREKEVLQWMAHGKSNSVIADILGLSRHTIDTLARRMFEKMHVNDRTSAVLKGIGSGLIVS